jgi:RNA polymerase sigma factor for flagellar operon FliA
MSGINIETYIPLARAESAAATTRYGIPFDDVYSYSLDGLWDASKKYDASKNVQFNTYATHRIRGSIIDGIRKYHDVVKRRKPGTIIPEIESLDAMQERNEFQEPIDACGIEEMACMRETIRKISKCLECLSIRAQRIMWMYYGLDMTMGQIAAKLGVSEGRISQIHKGTIKLIREAIGNDL